MSTWSFLSGSCFAYAHLKQVLMYKSRYIICILLRAICIWSYNIYMYIWYFLPWSKDNMETTNGNASPWCGSQPPASMANCSRRRSMGLNGWSCLGILKGPTVAKATTQFGTTNFMVFSWGSTKYCIFLHIHNMCFFFIIRITIRNL